MSKEMHVKVKNYQRIRNADVTFVPGLNVIQGASNQGKTALIRAIETAIFNLPRESHITLGETQSLVGIEYNDHEVIWRRDKTASSQVQYRVDGKIYAKCGRGQLAEVADALGITETVVNDRKFRVNFGKQMSYPFLLDSTPSEFFKFIVQSDEEDVTGVLDVMKKDFNEMKSNIKTYEATIDSLGKAYQKEVEEFNKLKPSLEYATKILDIDYKVEEYKKLLEEVRVLKQSMDIVSTKGAELTRWTEIHTFLSDSFNSLEVKRGMAEHLSKKIESYETNMASVEFSRNELSQYSEFIKKIADFPIYRDKLSKIQVLEARRSSIDSLLSQARHYKDIIDVESERVTNLKTAVQNYDDVIDFISKRVPGIETNIEAHKGLRDQTLECFRLMKAVEDLENKKSSSERIIEEIDKDLEEFPICPRCGAPIEKGKYHERHD